MALVALAWIYVVGMMAVAEATNSNGTLLGAFITFVLYGVLPLSIVLHLMGTPARRKARRASESHDANGGGHAAGDAVAPERKEP